jgi:RNA polymerase sigma factor (sigma-70 family)
MNGIDAAPNAGIEAAVEAAQNGSKSALEQVVTYAQGYVYNLALRMLQRPSDAEDATQEILIKLITNLAQFRGESAFSTWMYRLATNSLLNMQQRDPTRRNVSFETISQRIDFSLATQSATPEETLAEEELSEEIRRGCTLGMLYALDREDRLALILGELVGVNSDEGAYIMATTPGAYRQRLSRARRTLIAFVSKQCGVVNPESPCRCHKHVQNQRTTGELNPQALRYAQAHTAESAAQLAQTERPDLDVLQRGLALFRAHPIYASRIDFHQMIDHLFSTSSDNNPDV